MRASSAPCSASRTTSRVIHEGKLGSLQRFKDAVKEVAAGYECGMSIEKFNDIKEGDIFECFVIIGISHIIPDLSFNA